MITNESLNKIKELGVGIDHDIAFGGKSKGNQHLYRVVSLTNHLANSVKADISIAVAGAWLHDTALPSGDDYNYKTNKEIVLGLLQNINISDDDREAVAECVASHEGTVSPKSLEAQVVHDADVLEKAGILGIIRHTWKLTNSGKIDPDHVTSYDVDTVLEHVAWRQSRLQTDEAKRISRVVSMSLDDKTTMSIVETSASLASKGVITEKIAETLISLLNDKEYKILQFQLSQEYLYTDISE